MMFRSESLVGFYQLNYSIVSGQFGLTLTELENMIPYEREVFTHLIIADIQKQKKAQEQNG